MEGKHSALASPPNRLVTRRNSPVRSHWHRHPVSVLVTKVASVARFKSFSTNAQHSHLPARRG